MTNQDKIRRWALEQIGAPYVFGATGAPCTPALRRDKIRQYPQQAEHIKRYCPVLSGKQHGCLGCFYLGKRAFDCAQLTRRACEQGGIRLPSGASSQWKMAGHAAKGPIGPDMAGKLCLVFRAGKGKDRPMDHVGLSLGDGRVIDARNAARGVVIHPLSDYPWTHYAIPAVPEEGPVTPAENPVLRLQRALLALHCPLPRHGADGKLGPETLAALEQALNKLKEVQACAT